MPQAWIVYSMTLLMFVVVVVVATLFLFVQYDFFMKKYIQHLPQECYNWLFSVRHQNWAFPGDCNSTLASWLSSFSGKEKTTTSVCLLDSSNHIVIHNSLAVVGCSFFGRCQVFVSARHSLRCVIAFKVTRFKAWAGQTIKHSVFFCFICSVPRAGNNTKGWSVIRKGMKIALNLLSHQINVWP